MKVAILCGGLGTRLREETEFRPKPMVPIGTKPILWHIMKIYAAFGHRDFALALGYKGEAIKDYFLNYDLRNSDFTLDLKTKGITRMATAHDEHDWRVTFVETGEATMTGGRGKRLAPYLGQGEQFMLTYRDGVTGLDITSLVQFHHRPRSVATVTGGRPLARLV